MLIRTSVKAPVVPGLPKTDVADQLKPTFRMKWPSLRFSRPPPAQWTMKASRMIARMQSTSQKKNITMPGMTYPATVLDLVAMAASYPRMRDLFGGHRRAPMRS